MAVHTINLPNFCACSSCSSGFGCTMCTTFVSFGSWESSSLEWVVFPMFLSTSWRCRLPLEPEVLVHHVDEISRQQGGPYCLIELRDDMSELAMGLSPCHAVLCESIKDVIQAKL